MEIIRSGLDVEQGRSDRYTGVALISPVVHYLESRVVATSVQLMPGARTAWHSHPEGESILVTDGVGFCQRRGEPIEVLREGDRALFGPDEEHWHGAALVSVFEQFSLISADEQNHHTDWGPLVTDDEYAEAPSPHSEP